MPKQCERNDCLMLATQYVDWAHQAGGYTVCLKHAYWYRDSTTAARILPIGKINRGQKI